MGKVRRVRQKYHSSLSKNTPNATENKDMGTDAPRLVPIVKTKTDQTGKSSGNIFAGLEINLGGAKKTAPKTDEVMDTTVSDSADQRSKGKRIKKGRIKQRHQDLMKKIDAIQAGKQAEKERKKREKTKVVGDLHPMLNALPTLEELIANASKQQTSTKKGTGLKKQKEAKKEFMSDIQMMLAVHKDKIYNDDPFEAVTTAVRNRVLNDQEGQ
nr:protein FAM207A-like [Penaeus vannamei]XP_027231872.1 protein FAM207A-like [Penaeus vannamei]